MSDFFEIGYFQLENLILNQVQFLFFDIRVEKQPISDEPLKSMLQSSVPLEATEVEAYLKEKLEDKSSPIVVMCETGEISSKLALELNSRGYINVNVIENGCNGLVEDAQSMTHA